MKTDLSLFYLLEGVFDWYEPFDKLAIFSTRDKALQYVKDSYRDRKKDGHLEKPEVMPFKKESLLADYFEYEIDTITLPVDPEVSDE